MSDAATPQPANNIVNMLAGVTSPQPANTIYSNFGYERPQTGRLVSGSSVPIFVAGMSGGEEMPTRAPTRTPTVGLGVGIDATRGLGVGRVPTMPEGYGYAYGIPFRREQSPGWRFAPGAPHSSYNSDLETLVKFSQQGKDKGIGIPNTPVRYKQPPVEDLSFGVQRLDKKTDKQTEYNPYVVYNQDVFDKYRAGSSTWNPIYRDWFGSGMYNTELRTQEDFNWLAQNYGIGIHDVRAPKYAGTDTGGAEQAAWLQNELILDWMKKYGSGKSDEDIKNIIDYLTMNRPATEQPKTSKPKTRYYYGGGGGGWDGYGGSGYSPSWYNGLLSWRI